MQTKWIFAIWLVVLTPLASCGPEDGTLEIFITKSSDTWLADPLDPSRVTHLRVHITGPDMEPVEEIFEFEVGGKSSLAAIPAGKRRIITVEGLEGIDGLPFSRGRSLPTEIKSGHQTLDLFVARTGRFSITPGEGLFEPRFAAATAIDHNGVLWITGGATSGSYELPLGSLSSIETYDPTSGAIRLITCGGDKSACLEESRAHAAAVPLSNSILILGGKGDDTLAQHAVEIDVTQNVAPNSSLPQLDRFGALSISFEHQTLVVGGLDANSIALADAEIVLHDGEIETLTMPVTRKWHAASPALEQVFIFGGVDENDQMSSNYITFDFRSSSFELHTSNVTPRSHASIASFSDGRVLVVGGIDENGTVVGDVDLYDPRLGVLCNVGQLQVPRYLASAVALPGGAALVFGGLTDAANTDPTTRAEEFNPRFLEVDAFCNVLPEKLSGSPVPDLEIARYGASSHVLPNDAVLVVGGLNRDNQPIKHLEVFLEE